MDTALNETCRAITGTIRSTPVPCLYALAGIAPPHIRRHAQAEEEAREAARLKLVVDEVSADFGAPAEAKHLVNHLELLDKEAGRVALQLARWRGKSSLDGLEKEMFDAPDDKEVEACGIIYDEKNNVAGELHPDYTGWLTYQFDDDCRLIGIDYEDQVFRIVVRVLIRMFA